MEKTKDTYLDVLDLIKTYPVNFIQLLEAYHTFDISEAVIELNPQEIRDFFSRINFSLSAEIFEYLDEDQTEQIIKYLPEDLLIKIVENMEIDEAVDLLKYLNKEGLRLLNKISVAKRKDIMKMMAYKESEIGAFMSDSFLTINQTLTVREAMKLVTKRAHEVDYISILYIVENQTLIGYLRLKDLIVARANEIIEEIMENRFPTVHPHDDKEAVAIIMNETNESSIPVIDDKSSLLGIITHDDLMDIVANSLEEDYTKFAAVSSVDLDIESSNLKDSVKARLPWLTILLVLSMLTSIILSFFEGRLNDSAGAILLASKLAIYLPLILGMAGNTGTQSLAVMIRYLTKHEKPDKKRIKKHLFRELKTGFFQGVIIGVLIFIMINITTYITHGDISNTNMIYAIVTAVSISIALFVSTILGAMIPLIMHNAHIDPAVASGPFITTISDIITLTIYYSVSLIILLPLFQ